MARAKQYADRANIIKRIKLGSKWPFASVVEHNGRIAFSAFQNQTMPAKQN